MAVVAHRRFFHFSLCLVSGSWSFLPLPCCTSCAVYSLEIAGAFVRGPPAHFGGAFFVPRDRYPKPATSFCPLCTGPKRRVQLWRKKLTLLFSSVLRLFRSYFWRPRCATVPACPICYFPLTCLPGYILTGLRTFLTGSVGKVSGFPFLLDVNANAAERAPLAFIVRGFSPSGMHHGFST